LNGQRLGKGGRKKDLQVLRGEALQHCHRTFRPEGVEPELWLDRVKKIQKHNANNNFYHPFLFMDFCLNLKIFNNHSNYHLGG